MPEKTVVATASIPYAVTLGIEYQTGDQTYRPKEIVHRKQATLIWIGLENALETR